LDEFKALDPNFTVKDQAKLGYEVIKTGTQTGSRVWEKTVEVGGQSVNVRSGGGWCWAVAKCVYP
jgi:hypothetical protein